MTEAGNTDDYDFELPEELIAQFPVERREESRLFVCNPQTGQMLHSTVAKLANFLEPGTVMVFNNSKVRKARIVATTEHGGKVQLLFLERLPAAGQAGPACLWKVLVGRAKRQGIGKRLGLPAGASAEIVGLEPDGIRIVRCSEEVDDGYFERHGHIPLPPYISREDELADQDRYQTVYAKELGSAAAPTAGLHFTPDLLAEIDAAGILRTELTLHVGMGTFLPVRAERVQDHTMHEEEFEISPETAELVNAAKRDGRKVLAVGTTSVRSLESAWDGPGNRLKSGRYRTSIFLYPGKTFRVVDQVFTNFHTPKSTLLMLVSAFAGRDFILDSYRVAVEQKYRFFSYGDAMLLQASAGFDS